MLRRLVAAALLTGAALSPVTLPAVTGAAPACAAATGPHAALVIETGSRDLRLCVALDAPSVSGAHLIELAAEQQHLLYAFGSGGQAVCRLGGVGPQGDDCFADYPDFWGYWRDDGHGSWTWSSTGAASTTVGDGDLEGWVWGSGDTGSTHARPPTVSIAGVCTPPAPASPSATPSSHAASPSTAASAPGTSTGTPPPSRSPAATRSARPDPTATPTSSPSLLVAAADQGPAANTGPGPGLALALLLGAALAAGGWLRIRGARRRRETTAP